MNTLKTILLSTLLWLPALAHAADVKISALPSASALSGPEQLPCVQSGTTSKCTATQIKAWASASPALVTPNLGTPSAGVLTNATGLPEGGLSLTDITTNNASTSNHGFLKKLDNTATHYMDGTGAWSTPPASAAFGSTSFTGTGTANRIGTATTNNSNADTMFSASGVSKIPLVLQTSASNTGDVFRAEYSDASAYFVIQRDGNVIIDQKFGAVASKPLSIKYSGSEVAYTSYLGLGVFNGGLSVGGFFTASTAGDIVARDATIRHALGTGTSPTAPAGGGTCGTSAPSLAGKDAGFNLTVGSAAASSCTVTFGTAFSNAPVCVANAASTTTALNVATTTTTVVVSAAALTAGEVLHVVCIGF